MKPRSSNGPQAMVPAAELYPLAVGARALGLSRTTLYAMAKRGDVELVRLAGRTLIRRAEIQRVAATAEKWTSSAASEGSA